MSPDELKQVTLDTLVEIAPEIDPETIEASRPLREQVDLDSVDWLNFLVALHGRTGVDVPETDAARLHTLDALLEYLRARLAR